MNHQKSHQTNPMAKQGTRPNKTRQEGDQTKQDQTALKGVSLQGKLLQVYLSTVFAPKSRVDLADLSSPVWSCYNYLTLRALTAALQSQ